MSQERREINHLAGKLKAGLAGIAGQRGRAEGSGGGTGDAAAGGPLGGLDHQGRHGVARGAGEIAQTDHLCLISLLKDNEINALKRHLMPLGTEELRRGLRPAGGEEDDNRQDKKLFHVRRMTPLG